MSYLIGTNTCSCSIWAGYFFVRPRFPWFWITKVLKKQFDFGVWPVSGWIHVFLVHVYACVYQNVSVPSVPYTPCTLCHLLQIIFYWFKILLLIDVYVKLYDFASVDWCENQGENSRYSDHIFVSWAFFLQNKAIRQNRSVGGI